MNEVLVEIGELGLVPVIKIERAQDAAPLGQALLEAELPMAEITFRTAQAEEAIKTLARNYPQMLVGAGTVLRVDQVQAAIGAGAKFIVAPGFNPKVVDYCLAQGIAVLPGVNSPTGLEMALEKGLETVKFFPAEASGGLAFLKSMAGPFSGINFVPLGGINPGNMAAYLAYERVHAVGGTWIAKAELIRSGDFAEITRRAREALSILHGFELARLKLNADTEDQARSAAEILANLFLLPFKQGPEAFLAGTCFEVAKKQGAGPKGRIAIATNSLKRALAFLKRKGIQVIPGTARQEKGQLKSVSLDQEVAGFALELVQK
ncbi:MAG: bifunctional 4-hydroxy-2-oxoglutarate aldolase/2-dehydro-3-deoxy-phosphogluconate aldolase [Deltaproteobacteria bacterium]|nr:bifunctional 4-hydroxy-2-oxoglutarate aldolase/2-dehydro-3-deoxy-phosphogluconate aldolase [Deltaproteobacteria bacterium]